jgi:hypothetical protein
VVVAVVAVVAVAAGAAIVDIVIIIASAKMVAAGMVRLLFFLSLLRCIISCKDTNARDKDFS